MHSNNFVLGNYCSLRPIYVDPHGDTLLDSVWAPTWTNSPSHFLWSVRYFPYQSDDHTTTASLKQHHQRHIKSHFRKNSITFSFWIYSIFVLLKNKMRFLILFILLVISNAEKSKKGTKQKKSNDPKKVTEVKDVESTAPLPSFDVPRHTNDCKYHTCSYHIRVWYIECSYSDF